MATLSPISVSKVGNRTVIAPKESITHHNCDDLEATVEECISLARTDIILDCKAVAYMDSDALQLLVRMHEELRNRGNRFKIIGLNDVCLDIFVATRLIHLHVFEDIHEAMRNEQ